MFFFGGGNPSVKMWVPMADFTHSQVCFEWSLQADSETNRGWWISLIVFIQIWLVFPSSFELAMFTWVFLSFFSFFFSFYYGVTIINPTIKIPFEQENKPILRTSMYFLGSTPEWGQVGAVGSWRSDSRRTSCNTDFLWALRTFWERKILEASPIVAQSTWLWFWSFPWSSGCILV